MSTNHRSPAGGQRLVDLRLVSNPQHPRQRPALPVSDRVCGQRLCEVVESIFVISDVPILARFLVSMGISGREQKKNISISVSTEHHQEGDRPEVCLQVRLLP